MSILERTERDAILLHLVFAGVSLLVLAIPGGMPVGPRLCGLVLLYNLMLPLAAWQRSHDEWLVLWAFLVPLSLLQIFPDWFLASQLGVIIFPDTGSVRVGEIPLYMGGLWTIPLFVIVFAGRRIETRYTRTCALLVVCLLSALLFVGSEAILWRIPIWHAIGVTMVFHVAVYLVIPEILLGLSTFLAFDAVYTRSLRYRLAAAFTVMIIYLGNLSFFYFLIERLLLG